jgi:hypothetical protein
MRALRMTSAAALVALVGITIASTVAYSEFLVPMFAEARRGRWLPLSGVLVIEVLLVASILFRAHWWRQSAFSQHMGDAAWHIEQLKHAALSAQALTWVGALLLAYEPDWLGTSSLTVLISLALYDCLCAALVALHERTAKRLFVQLERLQPATASRYQVTGTARLPPPLVPTLDLQMERQQPRQGRQSSYSDRFAILLDTPRDNSTDTEMHQRSENEQEQAGVMW